MDNNKEKTVTSLQEFLAWVRAFYSYTPGKGHFFRGHERLEYELVPSVFRKDSHGKSFREVERDLYQEMINQIPHEFSSGDVFSNLVKMQHLGVPTRLLDVTQNAMVALYFSCANEVGASGRVFGFAPHQFKIKFPEDLSAEALFFPKYQKPRFDSGVHANDFWGDFTYDLCAWVTKFAPQILNVDSDDNIYVKRWREEVGRCNRFAGWDLEECLIFQDHVVSHLSWMLNRNEAGRKELFDILRDSVLDKYGIPLSSLDIQMFWNRVTVPLFVRSPLNNSRVIAQQGAFLLYPAHPAAACPAYASAKFTLDGMDSVIIDGECKRAILDELSYLGVSEHILFPESEKVARFVRDKYWEMQND